MEQSESINDLAAALAKAQGALEGARKDSNNPHFKSKYADLTSVWDACRAALTENGLSVIQAPGEMIDNRMTMTTMLLHSSGQWVRERLSIPLSKVDAQGYGSATTYARRYALAAMVGIAPEDDDGNAASQPVRNVAPKSVPAGSALITQKQVEELEAIAKDRGANIPAFCQYFKVAKLQDILAANFEAAKETLSSKKKRAA